MQAKLKCDSMPPQSQIHRKLKFKFNTHRRPKHRTQDWIIKCNSNFNLKSKSMSNSNSTPSPSSKWPSTSKETYDPSQPQTQNHTQRQRSKRNSKRSQTPNETQSQSQSDFDWTNKINSTCLSDSNSAQFQNVNQPRPCDSSSGPHR